MVRAILEGRKTQTRRVIKPQPDKDAYEAIPSTLANMGDLWDWHRQRGNIPENPISFKCPYGKVGDKLSVKEERMCTQGGFRKHRVAFDTNIILEITDIRVERLQEINNKDYIKEGYSTNDRSYIEYGKYIFAKKWFEKLWNSLAKKGFKWEQDPWVWVITFKKRS